MLFIHADYVNYKVKEKTPVGEKINSSNKENNMENPLIVFICVEKKDEKSSNGKKLVEKAFEEIKEVSEKIKVENIALFPFAHLSENISSPKFAIKILENLDSKLKESKFNSFKAPFGWYKEFEFKSKGHPLSVLSRTVYS